jgi:Lrp/AsnC family leucine-responsive transcriptional regulator
MIAIDNADRRILFELERNARLADTQLAKLVGKSKDAVRYRIKRLEQQRIIRAYRTWVDYARLGYRSSTLTFTLVNLPQDRKRFIEHIKNDSRVSWIGVAEGAWNVQATYAYQDNEELFELKNDLLSRYRELIIGVTLTAVVRVYVHDKSFLVNRHAPFLPFIDEAATFSLDDVTRGILRLLLDDARMNVATIAYRLKTSIDIVRNRLQHLEREHVIVRYAAIIDYTLIGYDLYKAFVYLKVSTNKDIDEILAFAEGSDKIIHLVKQIAPWDLELIIFATSFTEYNTFLGVFTQRFAGVVQKIETAIMSEDIVLPAKKLIFDR